MGTSRWAEFICEREALPGTAQAAQWSPATTAAITVSITSEQMNKVTTLDMIDLTLEAADVSSALRA